MTIVPLSFVSMMTDPTATNSIHSVLDWFLENIVISASTIRYCNKVDSQESRQELLKTFETFKLLLGFVLVSGVIMIDNFIVFHLQYVLRFSFM